MGIGRYAIVAASLGRLRARRPGRRRRRPIRATSSSRPANSARPARLAPPTPEQRQAADAAVAAFDSPTLTRFASEDEFRRYLGAVLAASRARQGWYAASGRIQFAQAETGAQSRHDRADLPGDRSAVRRPAEGDENVVVPAAGSRRRACGHRPGHRRPGDQRPDHQQPDAQCRGRRHRQADQPVSCWCCRTAASS